MNDRVIDARTGKITATTSRRHDTPLRAFLGLVVAFACMIGLAAPASAAEGSDGDHRVSASEIAAYLDLGQHDGRQLLRGFFFLSGPVVKLIPELGEARAQAAAAGYRLDPKVERQVLDRVQRNDPTFYADFAADMASGDHVRVRDTLTRASDLLLESIGQVTGSNGGNAGTYASLYIVVVAIMGVVSVAWLALGVSVVAAGMVTFWDASAGERSIPKDEVVATVVDRLGAPAGA